MDPNNPPNRLINSTSPYLLQHAYNPVDWHEWNDDTLKKAKEEDKLILISIGYSACHWCHVMERESFEDHDIAEVMNRFFICIKVDREERPDIDQVYMTAVQLMTGKGGWPLNCFALPDGKPVYGGTYFPKAQWKNILLNLADFYKRDKDRFASYANELTEGVQKYEQIFHGPISTDFQILPLNEAVANWSLSFDNSEGGPNRAPKFPLPNNYQFLLDYFFVTNDIKIGEHLQLTLKKMAYGGIYDQIGGGFSRYSVDSFWKVPHFEKMLYDNAQLVSLYSNAFRYFKHPVYKSVVEKTLDFVSRELTGKEGNFYSALDADSDGVEGKYYTWTLEELKLLCGNDFDLISDYYNINETGHWINNTYILLRKLDDEQIATKYHLPVEEVVEKISNFNKRVLVERDKRVKPGLDDKTLTSWNALMITGYCDAYDAFGKESYLSAAIKNANLILSQMQNDNGGLNHTYKNGRSNINGYLEDYAFFIQALIRLYQCTFSMQWLNEAKRFTEHVIEKFFDSESGLFYFTSELDQALIARKKEIQDNVIPASNSQMAINLNLLSSYFEVEEWRSISIQMVSNVRKLMTDYGSAYSNWLTFWLQLSLPLTEIVICGDKALEKRNELVMNYLQPGTLLAGCITEETLPLTNGRLLVDKTLIYVCKDRNCFLPVEHVDEALKG